MRTKKVNRYYCDFCKKAGLSAPHMARHEKSCTMNPNRVCRVCGMIDNQQMPMAELLVMLPNPMDYNNGSYGDIAFDEYLTIEANKALVELRQRSGNCPACILAAIRQKKIPVPMVTDFNFTKEMKAIWDNINEARYETYGNP